MVERVVISRLHWQQNEAITTPLRCPRRLSITTPALVNGPLVNSSLSRHHKNPTPICIAVPNQFTLSTPKTPTTLLQPLFNGRLVAERGDPQRLRRRGEPDPLVIDNRLGHRRGVAIASFCCQCRCDMTTRSTTSYSQ